MNNELVIFAWLYCCCDGLFVTEIITESIKTEKKEEKKEKKTKDKDKKGEKIEDVANDVGKAAEKPQGDAPVIEGKLEDLVS